METTKVILPRVRFSYANVFVPKAIEEGQKEKFSVSLIISKDDTDTVEKVKAAIQLAFENGKAKFGGTLPATWKNPLRDGDAEHPDDEAYVNSYFVNANSDRKPGVVKPGAMPGTVQEITEESGEFYSGCFGKASINFYAFNVKSKGVAAGLQNLMKTEDGDRLAGGSSAAEDFGTMEDDLMG